MENNMKKWLMAGILTGLAMCGAANTATAQRTAKHSMHTPRPCPASWLSLALDPENGTFNGMSHSGTLLVLRNLGPEVCTVPALPKLRFEDAQHHPLAVKRKAPMGMHPGPVMLPVAVPPGAELTARLLWVDGDVFSDGGGNGESSASSASPAYLVVPVGGQAESRKDGHALHTAFHGEMFGPHGQPPQYTQTPLHRDPSLCKGNK
jgi:hypothetical protein